MKAWETLLPPPTPLRRPSVMLDNIALVPGNLLPELARYQALANQLPHGAILVVLPTQSTNARQALVRAVAGFRAQGKRVRTVTGIVAERSRSDEHGR